MERPPSAATASGTTQSGDRASRDRALFDRIASNYARKDLYEPSRIARQARLQRTIDLTGHGPDADILEVGCGAGFAAQYLRGRFGSYTGIDYSDELIAFALQLEAGPDVVFQTVDLYEWQPGNTYDVIFAIGVLHHLPDIPRAMSAICSMLKPGGQLIVNEPQPANVVFHGLRKLRAILDASYSSEQEELEESALVSYFDNAGFEDIRTRAQGLLSTPFAEVTLRPSALAHPLSALACRVDTWLEDHFPLILKAVAWNIIVSGRRAGERRRPAHEPRPELTKILEVTPGLPRRMDHEFSCWRWR
jgi:trans-aconitate methyltransferase